MKSHLKLLVLGLLLSLSVLNSPKALAWSNPTVGLADAGTLIDITQVHDNPIRVEPIGTLPITVPTNPTIGLADAGTLIDITQEHDPIETIRVEVPTRPTSDTVCGGLEDLVVLAVQSGNTELASGLIQIMAVYGCS